MPPLLRRRCASPASTSSSARRALPPSSAQMEGGDLAAARAGVWVCGCVHEVRVTRRHVAEGRGELGADTATMRVACCDARALPPAHTPRTRHTQTWRSPFLL